MPRYVRMVSGDEYDSLTKWGRKFHRPPAGVRARVKRAFRRRERRALKGDIDGRIDPGSGGGG